MNIVLRRPARAVEILAASLAVLALSAGCGSALEQGTLTGRFYAVGGPAPGSPTPYSVGTVTADGPDGRHTVPITSDGRYTVKLSAGMYTLTGRPGNNGGNLACAGGTITVKRGQTSNTDVVCSIR